jgi:hypothetical protein
LPRTQSTIPDITALGVIVATLPRLDVTGRGMTTRHLVEVLYPSGRTPGMPGGYEELRAAIEHLAPAHPGAAPNARTLGVRLGGIRGRWLGGRRLVSTDDRSGVAK